MFDVRVTVRLKKGVSDPEGKNTKKALHLLGFDQVKNVNTLRIFDIQLDSVSKKEALNSAEQMCQRLLTNPVVHDYDISIEKM
ncbi:MAG: phosphoribosylformylglycinamidine synthase subunit PurS [Candidatus Thermoplasmatota archaeon]|nr:phosphoribosylformylglycinamidine synthase subunit PurS [Candidatus Thermoplasmatota archaeon]MBS3801128.1 phosphoribosylformylglycinamidine synthase subunit PurS [Candidatus Thermoplasmatota archaeon]